MSNIEKISISRLTMVEQKILVLLESKGTCLHGHIFKELKLSQTAGKQAILSLLTKGYIQNVGVSSYYELTGVLAK